MKDGFRHWRKVRVLDGVGLSHKLHTKREEDGLPCLPSSLDVNVNCVARCVPLLGSSHCKERSRLQWFLLPVWISAFEGK